MSRGTGRQLRGRACRGGSRAARTTTPGCQTKPRPRTVRESEGVTRGAAPAPPRGWPPRGRGAGHGRRQSARSSTGGTIRLSRRDEDDVEQVHIEAGKLQPGLKRTACGGKRPVRLRAEQTVRREVERPVIASRTHLNLLEAGVRQ